MLAKFPTVYLSVCEEFMGTEIHEKIFAVAGVFPGDFLNLSIKLLFYLQHFTASRGIYHKKLPIGKMINDS